MCMFKTMQTTTSRKTCFTVYAFDHFEFSELTLLICLLLRSALCCATALERIKFACLHFSKCS